MNAVNRAAYMTAVKKMEIREIPLPEARPDEIVLKVEYVGVCGSDTHFFESGMRKGKVFDLPFILGHECAGTVTQVGKNVTNLVAGDRVCFEPQITCGNCIYCKSGHYNMCPDVKFPSTPPYDGMLRDVLDVRDEYRAQQWALVIQECSASEVTWKQCAEELKKRKRQF